MKSLSFALHKFNTLGFKSSILVQGLLISNVNESHVEIELHQGIELCIDFSGF